ncbi:hypothetical protein DIPPA_02281 [Diplonema papillatum]|nr:hypothetical protein DIPPA_02281 [Diplonema papillatum]
MKHLQYAAVAAALVAAVCAADGRQPQYVFAHRVNTVAGVATAVAAGANIECDLMWDSGRGFWAVQHDSVENGPDLKDWLAELAAKAGSAESFTVLWLDVKTPNEGNLSKVVDLVVEAIPTDIGVFFECPLDDVLDDARGYKAIKSALASTANLGVGVAFVNGEGNQVPAVLQKLKDDGVKRSVATCGNPILNLKDTQADINAGSDPHSEYGFKQMFTWTNKLESTIADYMHPSQPHSANGQIVGEALRGWAASDSSVVETFHDAVLALGTQRLAVRNGVHSDSVWTPAPVLSSSHAVGVKTGHVSNAGTNGGISIVLYGSGTGGYAAGDALLDSPDQGDVSTVVVLSTAALQTVQSVSISLLNGNDWYAEHVTIGDQIAVFDRWLESGSSFNAGFTQGKTYSVTVKTGTRSGAGTDSNIRLTVVGSLGVATRAVLLNPRLSGNAFENGDTDSLEFDGRDVGSISSLTVESDGKYFWADWYLDYIEVNGERATFNRWIEEGTYTQAVQ